VLEAAALHEASEAKPATSPGETCVPPPVTGTAAYIHAITASHARGVRNAIKGMNDEELMAFVAEKGKKLMPPVLLEDIEVRLGQPTSSPATGGREPDTGGLEPATGGPEPATGGREPTTGGAQALQHIGEAYSAFPDLEILDWSGSGDEYEESELAARRSVPEKSEQL